MQVVRAALSNDVDDASDGASSFNAVGVVDHAKLAHCVRGRCGLLYARSRGNVICAVNGNKVVMNILAGERELGNRFNDHVRAAGGGIANSDAGGQQCEVDELAA